MLIRFATNIPDGVWTEQVFEIVGFNVATANIGMPAQLTAADGDLACAVPLAFTPATVYAFVYVNGAQQQLGGLTADCYFSSDGGVTAHTLGLGGNLVAGALLYWNGSIAGFELAPTDVVTFEYFYIT